MFTEIAVCPECGQVISVELPKPGLEREEVEKLALSQCNCPAGREYRTILRQIDEAKFNMEVLCSEEAEERGFKPIANKSVFDILNKAIELVGNKAIFSLEMKLPGLGSVKVKAGSSNQINITRSIKNSETLHANQKE